MYKMFKNRFEVLVQLSCPYSIFQYTEELKCCGSKEGGREGLSQARLQSQLLGYEQSC